MRMDCSLAVALSLAETWRMPLASMSKVTSICGVPRGAGGMPTSSNWPRSLLSTAISRSPWRTLTPTWVWLSAAVEKTWDFLVGMVVLRLMRRVKTPPRVSMPRESGVTSRRRMSLTSPRRTPPWMAAPSATTSSGLTPRFGVLPKNLVTVSWTMGTRVMPPTSRISLRSFEAIPASFRHFFMGSSVRATSGSTMDSNLARESTRFMCLGPDASAVMKGRLTSVLTADESSHFARSAASRRRWSASLSFERSMPSDFLNSSMRNLRMAPSKSSPPRWVSPLVAFTSKTPPEISRMETSNVPPPRSYTAMVCPSALSMPYASAAAVGSLMIRMTLRPAMRPASFVAWRCESLKYAGTVMTAFVMFSPVNPSAVSFIFCSTNAPTCDGEYCFPAASTQTSPLSARTSLYGMFLMSSCVFSSVHRRPISRFVANSVFSGFVTAWRFAAAPTNFSPDDGTNATTDGVVLMPSAFSSTRGDAPCMSATHELVVPRSMPMTEEDGGAEESRRSAGRRGMVGRRARREKSMVVS
mmetsp:Transcript_14331/g.38371  ORF Transcript_14331/g.38371 Transcript_14331/m.38371 type:complete len:527 (-) Transcript_14331:71-1651(-)